VMQKTVLKEEEVTRNQLRVSGTLAAGGRTLQLPSLAVDVTPSDQSPSLAASGDLPLLTSLGTSGATSQCRRSSALRPPDHSLTHRPQGRKFGIGQECSSSLLDPVLEGVKKAFVGAHVQDLAPWIKLEALGHTGRRKHLAIDQRSSNTKLGAPLSSGSLLGNNQNTGC
jgi:hypothetical protein